MAAATRHPARTALVVVDVVLFFATENAYVRAIVPDIARLASALRPLGGTVAWVAPSAVAPSAVAPSAVAPSAVAPSCAASQVPHRRAS